MVKKALMILTVLIACASMLALGCTSQSGTGPTATPTSTATGATDQANDTSGYPPLPPSDTNGTFSGMPPGLPGNNSSFNPMIPAAPGNNGSFDGNGTQMPVASATT